MTDRVLFVGASRLPAQEASPLVEGPPCTSFGYAFATLRAYAEANPTLAEQARISYLPLRIDARGYGRSEWSGLRHGAPGTSRALLWSPWHFHFAAAQRIVAAQPKVVALSLRLWTVRDLVQIAHYIKSLAPEIKVIAGGPEIAREAAAVALLERHPQLDAIIFGGDGELGFRRLLEHTLLGSVEPNEVPFLATRDSRGLFISESRALLDHLDEIPPTMATVLASVTEGEQIYYAASRGCPHQCIYCAWMSQRRVRWHSIERILAELRVLNQSAVPLDQVWLVDADLLTATEPVNQLLEFLADELRLPVSFEAGIESLRPAHHAPLKKLMSSGKVRVLEIGVQTVTEKARRLAKRGPLARFEQKLEELRREVGGAGLTFNLIFGLPGESLHEFLAGADRILDNYCAGFHGPCITACILSVPRGSWLHQHAGELGVVVDDDPPYYVHATRELPPEDFVRQRVVNALFSLVQVSGWLMAGFEVDASGLCLALFDERLFSEASRHGPGDRAALMRAWLRAVRQLCHARGGGAMATLDELFDLLFLGELPPGPLPPDLFEAVGVERVGSVGGWPADDSWPRTSAERPDGEPVFAFHHLAEIRRALPALFQRFPNLDWMAPSLASWMPEHDPRRSASELAAQDPTALSLERDLVTRTPGGAALVSHASLLV